MTTLYEIIIPRMSPTKPWCGDEYLGFAKSEEKANEFAQAEQMRIMQDPDWRNFYAVNRVLDKPAVKVRVCHAKLIDE